MFLLIGTLHKQPNIQQTMLPLQAKLHCVVDAFTQLLETCKQYGVSLDCERVSAFRALYHKIQQSSSPNVLQVQSLVTIFTLLQTKAFAAYPREKVLQQLMGLFCIMYPEHAVHIQEYQEQYQFCEGTHNVLLKGEVQAGKTLAMVLSSLCYLVCGRDVVIVVRSVLTDKDQFHERFCQVVEQLKEHMFFHTNFVVVTKQDKKIPSHPCVFVEIYHAPNLAKLHTRLVQSQKHVSNAVLYIDEADLRSKYVDPIFQDIKKTLFVSATVQDILVARWRIRANHILCVPSAADYKGVEHLVISERDLADPAEFFYCLCDIAVDTVPSNYHPKIVLITMDHRLRSIDRIVQWFITGKFAIDKKTSEEEEEEEDREFVLLPKEMDQRVIIKFTGAGVQMFPVLSTQVKMPNPNSLKNALHWLAMNGGRARFPNIIIIGGGMLDRGLNVSDYRTGYHVTHQVLYKCSSSTCANTMQALRILGIHSDNIPLKLYTTRTTKEKIINGYLLSEQVVDKVTSLNTTEYVDKVCATKIQINAEDIPPSFLAYTKVHHAFIVKPPTLKEEEEEEEENEEKDINKDMNDGMNDGMNDDLLDRKFRRWRRSNTKIAQFIQALDVNKAYTRQELVRRLEQAGFQSTKLSEMVACGPKKYGSVFEKQQGGLYRVTERAHQAYNRWFNIPE